jgi:hypothetical protein
MSKRAYKEPTLKPWDRRPWPAQGDKDEETVYSSVGRFLSFWEKYEAALAYLFASFFGHYPLNAPARRAYFSVRTFEGRADMLRAASSTYFDARESSELQKRFKEVLRDATALSPRRNDIAHGFVDQFQTEDEWLRFGWLLEAPGFALYPSLASFKERDTRGKPSYCMTSVEINYFHEHLIKLQPNAIALALAIIEHGRSTFFGKPPKPSQS